MGKLGRPPHSINTFFENSIKVHGNKYDYSKVEYVNSRTKVIIICPKHGEFLQLPSAHTAGEGCKRCSMSDVGNAVLDIPRKTNIAAYRFWRGFITRCHKDSYITKHPTYSKCSFHNDWLLFSNFKQWFESPESGYKEGYHLDKDILVKGNKIYSPDTCCFVPQEINKLFTTRISCRGNLPIGVTRNNKKRGKPYLSTITSGGKTHSLGAFNSPLEAFNAYKDAKERHIRNVAEKYFQEGKITERVYNALMKYEVEITD